ncbi:hypothetical protein [Nocardioides sp.]|uniref:hypothetical protein n=1 Tax=Nocardioides sp. TaxID=35761 RepID=UPI00378383BC
MNRRPFLPAKVYEDEPGRLRFGELAECLGQIELALRQLSRAQAAHRAEQSRRVDLGYRNEGRLPDELVALGTERADAMEFAIVAARRAVRAHFYLARRGATLPEFRQQEMVWALRDLYEHWHEWKVEERESFLNDNRWLRTSSAGARWAEASGGQRPEGTMGYTAGPPDNPIDPASRLTSWNSIDLDQLTEDLESLRDAVESLRRDAFEWELLDEEAAIQLVGPQAWTYIALFTSVRGRRAVDGVVRWERAMLLGAVRALVERWGVEEPRRGNAMAPETDGEA